MQIVAGRSCRVVVRFPWGERWEAEGARVFRTPDGALGWEAGPGFGFEPRLEGPFQEGEHWVMGWCAGACDVVVVISWGPGAPEP